MEEPTSGFSHSFMVKITWSLVRASPLLNLMPCRRVSVQVFKSGLASHFSSRCGRVMFWWSVTVRYSVMCRVMLESNTQE